MSVPELFVVMAKTVGPVCNLNCDYCYYLPKTEMVSRDERFRMRRDVLETYVSACIAASPGPVVPFDWHGGEPTLAGIDFYREAVELQRRYLPTGWRCLNNLQTNGTLLDEQWCAFLAEHHFAVGISCDRHIVHTIAKSGAASLQLQRSAHAMLWRAIVWDTLILLDDAKSE